MFQREDQRSKHESPIGEPKSKPHAAAQSARIEPSKRIATQPNLVRRNHLGVTPKQRRRPETGDAYAVRGRDDQGFEGLDDDRRGVADHPPRGVFGDRRVIAKAPIALSRRGVEGRTGSRGSGALSGNGRSPITRFGVDLRMKRGLASRLRVRIGAVRLIERVDGGIMPSKPRPNLAST